MRVAVKVLQVRIVEYTRLCCRTKADYEVGLPVLVSSPVALADSSWRMDWCVGMMHYVYVADAACSMMQHRCAA